MRLDAQHFILTDMVEESRLYNGYIRLKSQLLKRIQYPITYWISSEEFKTMQKFCFLVIYSPLSYLSRDHHKLPGLIHTNTATSLEKQGHQGCILQYANHGENPDDPDQSQPGVDGVAACLCDPQTTIFRMRLAHGEMETVWISNHFLSGLLHLNSF